MRASRVRSFACWSVLSLPLLASTGCLAFNKQYVRMSRTTSVGAELEDLKRAREVGAITDDEYERLEAAIKSQLRSSGDREDGD